MSKTRAWNKIKHTQARLMERFGIDLHPDDIWHYGLQCRDYNIEPTNVSDDGLISVHPHELKGQLVVFVYDWSYNCITTVYHKSWFTIDKDNRWIIKDFKITAKQRRKLAKVNAFNAKIGYNGEGIER